MVFYFRRFMKNLNNSYSSYIEIISNKKLYNKIFQNVRFQIAMSLQRRLHFNSLMILPPFMTYMLASKMDFVWNFLNILSFLLILHFKINWITTLPSLSIMKNPKCHKILQNHSVLFIHADENTLHFSVVKTRWVISFFRDLL